MRRKSYKGMLPALLLALSLSAGTYAAGAGPGDSRGDTLRIGWSRTLIDGSRTGCVSPSADNVEESLGKVSGRTYHAPNGKVFRGGCVPSVARAVLDAQPEMSAVKTVIGHSPAAMKASAPESPLSNMFIDVIMAATEKKAGRKVHMGIGNFGGIRTDMPEGDILLDDMLSMFPFKNSIVYVALKGADIRVILEQMAATRIQVLGGVRIVVENGKLVSAEIDGAPLDDEKTYGVATISFLLNGGDNLYVGKNAVELISFDDIDIIDVMLDYIHSETAAGRQITYASDGRVKINPIL